MKNKKNLSILIIACILMSTILTACNQIDNKQENNQAIETIEPIENNINITLDKQVQEDLKVFNEKLDEYYITNWNENEFLSSYSYLIKNTGEEVVLQDIEKALDYKTPDSLKDISLHFVKPKSLKPYLGDKILDDDPEILTVYSALPVEGGMYISSKFDEGGALTDQNYKDFVLKHSWAHGEIKTLSKDDKDYKNILDATIKKDKALKDGNVKYLAVDDKYAIIVISSKDNPAYIKEYALQKDEKTKKYEIIIEDLESRNSKIFVNYAYTDFELGLLPLYEIKKYTNISSNLDYIVDSLKESNQLKSDEELTYSCQAGNFSYLEFKSGLKMLLYKNEKGLTDIYEVDNFKTALSQMLKLEQNPPAFILKFD